ncbi:MAG TPA: T9SS type A sorting domain-containing protein [Saprospiraceae bacterium]|nr:T9SS type A sorting domain-containing protein [Saprospiraceae bacterium]
MEKLATSGFKGYFFLVLSIVMALSITMPTGIRAQGCIMVCPPTSPPVPISLSSDCSDILTYNIIGVFVSGCSGPIDVQIIDNGIPIGNVIDTSMIGQTFMVIVSNPSSGQSCMTFIMVVDKQAPIVDCPDDVTLACNTDLSEYLGLTEADISDCSAIQSIFRDDVLISSGNCTGNIISQYERTYIVVDVYNNATTCEQLISLAKADLVDVVFPPDLTGVNALSCFPSPNTTPANTGYPTVEGENVLNGTFCNLISLSSDITVAVCSGSYKIFRTWTVYDWCANNIFVDSVQVIEIVDRTPPVVNAPADLTASTGSSECSADVILPPALITEDCSTSWTVRTEGPFGTMFTNGGLVSNLPVGVHRIIYKATNDCGLEGVDTMFVSVLDLAPPSPVCNQSLNIPVNNFGTTLIPASTFDAASYDNCGPVYFKVKRMTTQAGSSCQNPGNPGNAFDDFVQFCCADIAHNPIRIILRVYDSPPVPGPVSDTYLTGHFNDCMVQVEVQDKLPPSIICPNNLTISCQFPYTAGNLGVFGDVELNEADRDQICIDDPGDGLPGIQCVGLDGLALDNCGVTVTSTASITVNNCGAGSIVRTFIATDDGGRQSSCQQVITIINYDPFSLSDITWPSDLITTDICELDSLDPEDLAAPYNAPFFIEEQCDLIGVSYDDDVFAFAQDQPCFKILRTWTVIDWCQLNTPSGGIWTHLQVIKVTNNVPPIIEPLEDISTCSFDPACGGLTLNFDAAAHDDCSTASSLSWTYTVDLDNNGSFDFISPVLTGESIEFSRNIPIGSHRILYSVWDHCGNITTVEQSVSVVSCKPPSAKCIDGLSTNLMAMDLNGDGTADWGMVTLQAEMFDAGSDHPCGNPITLAFSSDPNDVTKIFDCSDIGPNEIELWAIDTNGLTDFCITSVDVQDNNAICPNQLGGTGVISGNIKVPGSGNLAGAMVYLDGSNLAGSASGSNGYFVFPAMPFGGQFVVRPIKQGDAKNGVTTLDLVQIQKHLLGIKSFESPFQFIAADANNSQSITAIDILQLRKLILGYYDELPNSPSWRFIDEAHVFPDPQNPWISTWPETYTIKPFSTNMNDVNFDAVKIGDVNLTANTQLGNSMVLPRGDQSCEIQYVVSPQPEQEVFRVDINLLHAEKFNAVQFSFLWDESTYELVDWNPGENLSKEDIRMPQAPGEGASILAFTSGKWSTDRMLLLTMWVKQKSSRTFPFKLFLKPQPTTPLAYVADEANPIRIQMSAVSQNIQQLYNRPNPFKDQTTILYQSIRQEDAMINFYDLNGRLVLSRDVRLIAGENEFVIHKSELRGGGMYTYEIKSDFQHSTNRMIIVN